MHRTALTALLSLALGSSAFAQSPDPCTRETLTVQRTPVTVSYCVQAIPAAPAGADLPVPVLASYSTRGGSFSERRVLRFIAGEADSRVMEDVSLQRLGLTGTLHLTLLLHRGSVAVESALLTPGAVTIK